MTEKNGIAKKFPEMSYPLNENLLYRVRTSEGLKITELANFSGVSGKTISDLEKGNISSTEVTRRKIINGLNKNPNKNKIWLYEEVFS